MFFHLSDGSRRKQKNVKLKYWKATRRKIYIFFLSVFQVAYLYFEEC